GTLLAFLAAVAIGADGRAMIGLILGAVMVGTAAALLANLVTRLSKIRIDTAMAVTLTTFFGAGMLLMRVISAGAFPGKGRMLACRKGFALRPLDPGPAGVLGFSARCFDTRMFVTNVIGTVIGVKAVGLVLMAAFVVTPPAAARQWTRTLPAMVMLSAGIG